MALEKEDNSTERYSGLHLLGGVKKMVAIALSSVVAFTSIAALTLVTRLIEYVQTRYTSIQLPDIKLWSVEVSDLLLLIIPAVLALGVAVYEHSSATGNASSRSVEREATKSTGR